MRYVEVGGVKVSAIGLGTWQFGSKEWDYGEEYASRTAIAITHRALDLGVNFIDTAEIYAFGNSERIVGRALAGRRDEAFIATKVFPVLPLSPIVQQRAVASADRLGVETIDLYQVHWPNPIVPVGQPMAGMGSLLRTGVIRHVGVSNFGLSQWRGAEASLGRTVSNSAVSNSAVSNGAVLSNQVKYNLVQRKPEAGLLPWAQTNDRLVIAYSPLAQGLLSGRYDATNRPGGVRANNTLFLPENLGRARRLLEALREVAASHGASSAQVALAWLIRRPNVIAIPGASSVAQLESNAAAADLDLSDDEDRILTEASSAFAPLTGVSAAVGLVRAKVQRS